MPGNISTNCTYAAKKINRLRWKPCEKHSVRSSVFAAGSWSDEQNTLTLWNIDDTGSMLHDSRLSDDDVEPKPIASVNHVGDVTALLFVNSEHILTGSSTGSVHLYQHHPAVNRLELIHEWPNLHHRRNSRCSCTAVALGDNNLLASVGADGRLNIFTVESTIKTYERADCCMLNGITFMRQTEIAAVNSVGQFKIWDIREKSDRPIRTLSLCDGDVPLHCMDRHPTQSHIVATGGQDGRLFIWDIRQERFPITVFSEHTSDIWEVRFHPTQPNHLFTCSNEGDVWHWDSSTSSYNESQLYQMRGQSRSVKTNVPNPWLGGDTSRHNIVIKSLLPMNTMPVNTVDICANTLLCGTDGEQIFIIRNLNIC